MLPLLLAMSSSIFSHVKIRFISSFFSYSRLIKTGLNNCAANIVDSCKQYCTNVEQGCTASIVTNCSTILFNMLTSTHNVDSTTLFNSVLTNTEISLLKLSEFTCADKQNLKQNKYINFIKSCLDYNIVAHMLR